MIRILEVEVNGMSTRGEFRGKLELSPGLNVISADNRYGKSLAFAAITWGLGVEQIYGVHTGSNAIFPDAARNSLEADGRRDVEILSSNAHLVLERHDESRFSAFRNIIGGDQSKVRVRQDEGEGVLQVGYGSAKDPTAGFQRRLRDWAGLPDAQLVRSQGGRSPIYLENLAPLFLIEQLRGWTGLQAEQVYRYGLQEVANAAIEYILGLDEWLRARLKRQQAVAQRAAMKEEARSIASDFSALLQHEGWTGELSTHGSVADIVANWAEFDPLVYVSDRFNFDLRAEQSRLQKQLKELKNRVGRPPENASTKGTLAISHRVVELKEAHRLIEERLRSARSQLHEQIGVLENVTARWRSARDLLRLKREGVGMLPEVECPTCHQTVSPERLMLQEQSADAVSQHVDSVDRQRELLRQNVERIRAEIVALDHEHDLLTQELEVASRSLELTTIATSPAMESAIEVAGRFMEVERELDRNRQLVDRLNAIKARLLVWLEKAKDLETLDSDHKTKPKTLEDFQKALRQNLVSLAVGGITENDGRKIKLDDQYEPLLDGRNLPTFGSASDRARLVMAYVWALLDAGGRHPGFIVLDEPVQQNPDPANRARWIEFVCAKAFEMRGQVVLFTSLSKAELKKLEKAGVAVQALEGRFLKLNSG